MTGGDDRFRPRRLVYLGTPDLAVPPLRALDAAGFDIALVVSRPDRKRGRGGRTTPSPVKAEAERLGIPVSHDVDDILTVGADLGVVVAYGRIIRPHVLDRLPLVNLHFSLLPRWRGAAPVERAILAGDTTTGVCLMVVDVELDTGAVHRCDTVEIGGDETATELGARLSELGAGLLVAELTGGLGEPVPQEGTPTYADKIDNAEHRLDLSRPAVELHRLIRLGRAWCEFRGRRLKILTAALVQGPPGGEPGTIEVATLEVATGDGRLRLVRVQAEGKAPVDAASWRNGVRPTSGERLV